MNDIESIRQAELDNKEYHVKNFDLFEFHKSENILYKTETAIRNLQDNQAYSSLKKSQDKIEILN
jgi:hypothetical protein